MVCIRVVMLIRCVTEDVAAAGMVQPLAPASTLQDLCGDLIKQLVRDTDVVVEVEPQLGVELLATVGTLVHRTPVLQPRLILGRVTVSLICVSITPGVWVNVCFCFSGGATAFLSCLTALI